MGGAKSPPDWGERQACGCSWTHLNIGSVPLGGSLEGQVRQRRLLASSNIHLEDVARLRRHDADDRVSFAGDILSTHSYGAASLMPFMPKAQPAREAALDLPSITGKFVV